MNMQITRINAMLALRNGAVERRVDELSVEEPLEIRVRGRPICVTMRTPGNDAELAAGFLLTEGIITGGADVMRVEPCRRNEHDNVVDVILDPLVSVDFERLTRHVFASSSCGLCGKATIDSILNRLPAVDGEMSIEAATLLDLPRRMHEVQATFNRTGGLHAAALFDATGSLIVLREDVGRHNAVDKIVGFALLNRLLPLDSHVLLVSGRSSFEIVQKALAARVPVVAAVSAPSSLAVQFADECGQTLVGFLREGRMNVYSHPQRIRFEGGGG